MSLSVCDDFKITACYIIDISIIMMNQYCANVAKLVDALVLGTSWLPSGSSSLPIRTTQIYKGSRLIVSLLFFRANVLLAFKNTYLLCVR